MGSGSEVHRLIWYGNLFLSKLMRGACQWESHPSPGFAAVLLPTGVPKLEAGLLQEQWREPSWHVGFLWLLPILVVSLPVRWPSVSLPVRWGKKSTTHRVALRKGSDPGRKVLVHLRGPCPGQCLGIVESLPPSGHKAQGSVLRGLPSAGPLGHWAPSLHCPLSHSSSH